MQSDLKGRTALVTGASSGLGAAFARLLAERGADVIITARRKEKLDALAKELEDKHGVAVDVVALDLAEPGSPAKLWEATEGAGRAIDVLVNNAGGSVHAYFVGTPWERIARQIQLNVVSLTELTHRFAKAMVERGRGYVLNVSSIGAYTPTPSMATYSAGKAFVRDFTEALHDELAGSELSATVVCPGGTRTAFHDVAGAGNYGWLAKQSWKTAEQVASFAVRAMVRRKRIAIPGVMNKLSCWGVRLIPRRLASWLARRIMGRPRD